MRELAAIALSVLAGCSLFAAPPSDPQINDFLMHSGVNLPWLNHGWDLGDNPWGGPPNGFHSNRVSLAEDFAYLRQHNVKLCRVFLFCDFRTGLEYDGNGNILGFDPYVDPDMHALLEVANEYGIRVLPVLMNYQMADGVEWEGTNKVGEHAEFITNPVIRSQLLTNIVAPFVREFGTNPAVHAWDIMNEPRFATNAPAEAVKSFIEDCATLITNEAPGAWVCFGNNDRCQLGEYGETNCNLVQIHFYDSMADWWDFDMPASNISAKPVLFGEVQMTNVAQKLDSALSNGYVGVLFWSLNAPCLELSFTNVASDYSNWVAARFEEINRDLSIVEIAKTGGTLDLGVWPTYGANSYAIEASTNLLQDAWQAVQDFTGAAFTNRTRITLPIPATPAGFYRVRAKL